MLDRHLSIDSVGGAYCKSVIPPARLFNTRTCLAIEPSAQSRLAGSGVWRDVIKDRRDAWT